MTAATVDRVTVSGGRQARIVRCPTGRAAARTMGALRQAGAAADDLVVIVRDATFQDRGGVGAARRAGPELLATVAGAVAGAWLAGPWGGLLVALLALLLVGAIRTGRRDGPPASVAGRRYDVVARGDAVAVVDRVLPAGSGG